MQSIHTERLLLRRVQESDWQAMQSIWQDFGASTYARFDKPHDMDAQAVRSRIARWAQYADSMEHIFLAVCLDDVVIGYIACNNRQEGYELGYCFHSAYHGKGYARESHAALVVHLAELGVTKLTAGTALENQPSVRLLESLGFRLVGTEAVSFYCDAEGKPIVFEGGIFELTVV